eukprot:TRINITY_DN293_c0_g1_i2.p1 TRINITY_DN293_c0_g1~~TRINITY_DN293_c0_g1_i2.p1  ORF type:complete len:341 (+),score=73.97 TRINITY_DN293_c0_g1_i2:387-1409(+)
MVAELAHEYPPKIKYIVIPKRRVAQSSHTNSSNPYSFSPFATSFDSNPTNHTHSHSTHNFDAQQHIRNRYLMLLEREKNRDTSPSPPRNSGLPTHTPTTTTRLSNIFREATAVKPLGGFPPVPLSSSYRSPLRIVIADRDREIARDVLPSSIQLGLGSRKVESENKNSRLGSIESTVESLLRKRRLGEYENDGSRENAETKRFREESERLAGLIDFIRRRDDSLAAIARGSAPIVDDDSDSDEDEEDTELKSDLLRYSNEWVTDAFVNSDDEDEDEDDYNEEESDVIPYTITKRENPIEESSSGSELNEESETVVRKNTTNQIYSTWDNNSDSESDDDDR